MLTRVLLSRFSQAIGPRQLRRPVRAFAAAAMADAQEYDLVTIGAGRCGRKHSARAALHAVAATRSWRGAEWYMQAMAMPGKAVCLAEQLVVPSCACGTRGARWCQRVQRVLAHPSSTPPSPHPHAPHAAAARVRRALPRSTMAPRWRAWSCPLALSPQATSAVRGPQAAARLQGPLRGATTSGW